MPASETSQQTKSSRPFQFTGRIRSFRHAIAGVLRMMRYQHNAWIHAAATLVVLAAAFVLRISAADWCWIILAISIVWTAEALNTAFEFFADAVTRVSPTCP
jgi:diacylglycerol kinase (ATP)